MGVYKMLVPLQSRVIDGGVLHAPVVPVDRLRYRYGSVRYDWTRSNSAKNCSPSQNRQGEWIASGRDLTAFKRDLFPL